MLYAREVLFDVQVLEEGSKFFVCKLGPVVCDYFCQDTKPADDVLEGEALDSGGGD